MGFILASLICSFTCFSAAYGQMAELEDMEVEAETSFFEAQNAQRQLKTSQQELARQRQETETLRDAAEDTKKQADRLRVEAEKTRLSAEKERASLSREKKQLLAANKKNLDSIKKSQKQIDAYEKELLALGHRVKRLQEQNHSLALQLEEQHDRRAHLAGRVKQRQESLKSQQRLLSTRKNLLEASVAGAPKSSSRVPASGGGQGSKAPINVELRSAQPQQPAKKKITEKKVKKASPKTK